MIAELTLEQAKDTAREAQEHVDVLRDRQSELTAAIQECADQARIGKAVGDLNALAVAKSACDREVIEAEAELARSVQQVAETVAEADRQRFTVVVAELKDCREEFRTSLRAACLLLGKIIRLRDEAGKLAQSQVRTVGPNTSPIVYRDPFTQTTLAEVNEKLPEAADFTVGAGPDVLLPDMHTGWRTEVKICPLHPKGEKPNG